MSLYNNALCVYARAHMLFFFLAMLAPSAGHLRDKRLRSIVTTPPGTRDCCTGRAKVSSWSLLPERGADPGVKTYKKHVRTTAKRSETVLNVRSARQLSCSPTPTVYCPKRAELSESIWNAATLPEALQNVRNDSNKSKWTTSTKTFRNAPQWRESAQIRTLHRNTTNRSDTVQEFPHCAKNEEM